MITWIQKTFQQHFRLVFVVLLGLIIVSFVFITNASSGFGNADHQVRKVPFFDLNLGSKEDGQRLATEAGLAVELQYGVRADNSEQFQEFSLNRYAALYLANQLRVPGPTDAELTAYIRTLRAFLGPDGTFDAKRYEEFRKSIDQSKRVTQAQVRQVLSDNLRIERVTKLVTGPGYVLPSDVKQELTLADTSWTLATAVIDRASFTPAITPTEAELAKHFEENSFTFVIPARVSVSYAEFAAEAFLPYVPPAPDAEVRAFYDANPARFPVADRKPGQPANPDSDYALVRSQVEAAYKLSAASRLAATAASDLSLALYDRKLAPDTPAFDALLAERKIALKSVPPFAPGEVPAALGGSPQISDAAFRLSKERPTSDPLSTGNNSVILFWKDTIPSRQPALAEVRADVSKAYIENEKQKRFSELGKTLRAQIQTRLKAGDTFEKAANTAAADAKVKVTVKTLPAFTLRQPPQDLEGNAYGLLENLKQGEVSEMAASPDKGLIVFAQDKKVPDITENNPQYVAARTRIAQSAAAANGQAYFRELVSQELAKSSPDAR